MLRYDGIDLPLKVLEGIDNKTVLKGMQDYVHDQTGFDLVMAEKAYTVSPLEKQIRKQLDYASKIPQEYSGYLHVKTLTDLQSYPAQKWYFERFAAKIIDSSNFVIIQRRYQQCPNDITGERTMPSDVAVAKTSQDLTTSFGHVTTRVPGEDRPKRFIQVWLSDVEMRTSPYLEFIPYNKDIEDFPGVENDVFNLFKGFNIPKHVSLKTQFSEFTHPFHYVGLQLCENNAVYYQFFWNCIAHKVQKPRDRLRIAFAFQGKEQGLGGDVYFDTIGRLLGDNHYTNTANINDLVGEHSEGFQHKLLVVANECKFNELKGSEDKVKAMITNPTLIVNPKCVRPFKINLFALVIFMSNHANAVAFDNDDNERRNVTFCPTSGTIPNEARPEWGYSATDWAYLCDLFKSPIFIQALYEDLMNTDLSNFSPEGHRPCVLGAEYFRASEKNSKTHAKFFAHALRNGLFNKYATNGAALFPKPPATESWIIDEVKVGVDVSMDTSTLHEMYYDYMQNVNRVTARKDECGFMELFKSSERGKQGPYATVVQTFKSGVRKYKFNTTHLWMVLVKKKWVAEAASYYAWLNEKLLDGFFVDRRFTALSELMENTDIALRAKVNPGKQRPA